VRGRDTYEAIPEVKAIYEEPSVSIYDKENLDQKSGLTKRGFEIITMVTTERIIVYAKKIIPGGR
jgi:hypothetical protein